MKRILTTLLATALLCSGCVKDYSGEYPAAVAAKDGKTQHDDGWVEPDGGGDVSWPADCEPKCEGRECGPNGCGGTCGKCTDNLVCSDDGVCTCPEVQACFGACCPKGNVCDYKLGKCCIPDCKGKKCGDNGCHGECGKCIGNLDCNQEQSACVCFNMLCNGVCCADDEVCDKGNECCLPYCQNKECGDDGCNGVCGNCPAPANPCMNATCEKGKCKEVPNSNPCEDANPCTQLDACKAGACVGSKKCDDASECTTDFCNPDTGDCAFQPDPEMEGVACTDANPCTQNPVCTGGLCYGELTPPEAGGPEQCLCFEDEDCLPLENDDVCDGTLICKPGKTDADPGTCVINEDSKLQGTCSDWDLCTEDLCDSLLGCVFPDKNCDDGVPCTQDSCDLKTGECVHTPDEAACDDNVACTDDACEAVLGCVNAPDDEKCDDGEYCTKDICTPLDGCKVEPVPGDCEDGDKCTAGDACAAGKCESGGLIDCDDGNPCTLDACEPDEGCIAIPTNDEILCDDGNPCTPVDQCKDGQCVGSGGCDDGNPCTDDTCEPATGCVFTNDDTNTCADEDVCDGEETCSAGQCVAGNAPTCDDGKLCTDDTCEPATGCVFANDDTNDCHDADLCNGEESCAAGLCEAGVALVCDDGKPCTDDTCEPATGCVFANDDTNDCHDADLCNGEEACVAGSCMPGMPLECPPDALDCTVDECLPASGCAYTPDNAACEDGNPDTVNVCDPVAGCVIQ
jgi:hypothetical protein